MVSDGGHVGRHLAVLPSNTQLYMADGIPYHFYQNTNFRYLTGFLEADSVLVLECEANVPPKASLFVKRRDRDHELWHGTTSGPDDVYTVCGIENAKPLSELGVYLRDRAGHDVRVWGDTPDRELNIRPEVKASQDAVSQLPLTLHEAGANHLVQDILRASPGRHQSCKPFLDKLRVIKSPDEVQLMHRCGRIISKAFDEAMATSPPCERSLFAVLDGTARLYGAEMLAYPPVVAGGNRACTLHYIKNDQLIKERELILVDAGCMFGGYCSDVTRTWNVSGRFTGPQLDIYQALLAIQTACISACVPGNSLNAIYTVMLTLLGDFLKSLYILPDHLSGQELRRTCESLCPHHVGHYLGLDVHDCESVSRASPLTVGQVVTIEPGVYFPNQNRTIPERYRGIGVRIEDDVLVTAGQPVVLTDDNSTEVDVIQQMVRSKFTAVEDI